MPILEIRNLHVHYGAIAALRGISFHIQKGEIVAVLGANGAGKSTALRTISGLTPQTKGTLLFKGRDLEKVAPHKRVGWGISQIPEGRRLFPRLSVADNLRLGAFLRRDRQAVRQDLERVYHLFPRLLERQKQLAGSLSGGEQQMLAIGRGLMSRPDLLLLDEPSLGLAPLLVQEIFQIILEINRQGTTVLLVEQNAHLALEIAHRGYVLETGTISLEGKARSLAADPRIRQAYLGV